MKIIIFPIIMTVCIVGCKRNGQNLPKTGADMLTKEEIIKISNEVVLSQEFTLEEMDIYFDIGNKEWQKVLDDLKKDDPDFANKYERELKGKSYQAVRYRPDITKVASGEFWVFIDKTNGEVITFCGGI